MVIIIMTSTIFLKFKYIQFRNFLLNYPQENLAMYGSTNLFKYYNILATSLTTQCKTISFKY
jgi:hypothetical protein